MLIKGISQYFDEVIEATDGIEAVHTGERSIEQHKTIDCIFMDSIIPNMNGIDACKCICTLGFASPIYVVIGNALPEDVSTFLLEN